MSSSHNPNPNGNNQYGPVLKANDPGLRSALDSYHRRRITCNKTISELLLADHGIVMKPRTVKKRRKELDLLGSRDMANKLSPQEAEQLVIDAVNEDPADRRGARTLTNSIARKSGIHLPRDFVASVMRLHFPDGCALRNPTKKVNRAPKAPLGIHERWVGDGHDKLYGIGFPVWAIVDDATGKWLGAWVVPGTGTVNAMAYLFLCLVEEHKGIPLQFAADRGTETTMVSGFANALREIFHPDYDRSVPPANTYLRSVQNFSIERSRLKLCLPMGDSAIIAFNNGYADKGGPYEPDNPVHNDLCQWLWPKLLQKKLDEFREERNSFKPRKTKGKLGPNGISRNIAFSLPHTWGGQNLLSPVDVSVIQEIKTAMGGDGLLNFVPAEYNARVQSAYDSLGIQELDFRNVWNVFSSLLSRIDH